MILIRQHCLPYFYWNLVSYQRLSLNQKFVDISSWDLVTTWRWPSSCQVKNRTYVSFIQILSHLRLFVCNLSTLPCRWLFSCLKLSERQSHKRITENREEWAYLLLSLINSVSNLLQVDLEWPWTTLIRRAPRSLANCKLIIQRVLLGFLAVVDTCKWVRFSGNWPLLSSDFAQQATHTDTDPKINYAFSILFEFSRVLRWRVSWTAHWLTNWKLLYHVEN